MINQTFPRIGLCLATFLAAGAWAAPRIEPSRIRTDTITRDVIFAPDGRFKEVEPTPRDFDVVILENGYLKVIVCPSLGERIVNVIDKTTGRAFLYEGIIRYSGSAYSGGGGSGGGLHVNHPLYHGGSGYVAPLPYTAEVTADGTAVLTLAYTSYPHLQHTIWQIRLHPDEAAFRCTYRFENLAPYPMGFNPWINSAYPMRGDAQFVLPADAIAGHWFGINPIGGDGDWGHHLRPWPIGADGRDQSYATNRQWSAAFAYGLTGGYAGICFHERNDGMARVFDPEAMPGAKAAGAWSPEGWLEIWGAFTHNMEDPRWIGPHETITAEDMWFPFRDIGGMTWAGTQGALNLRRTGNELLCGVYVLRDHGMGAIRLTVDGHPLLQAAVPLSPETPFSRTLAIPAETDEVRLAVLDADGRVLMDRQVFFSDRPARRLELPETPWHRKNPTTQARWEEAFTPLMGWGPWYHPPTSYRKALEQEPGNREAMLGLARSLIKEADADLFRRGRRDGTPEAQYEEVASLLHAVITAPAAEASPPGSADAPPADAASDAARARLLLGLVQFRTGALAGARETFAQPAGTAHDTALAHYHLALIAARAGTWPDALAAAQQAVAMAPDSTLPRLLLATALLKTGSPDAVAPVLRPLRDRNPGDLHALALQQRAAEAAGDAAQAAALDRERHRLATLAPVQAQAAQAALDALAGGRDLGPLAVDTTRGADTPPGRDPGEATDSGAARFGRWLGETVDALERDMPAITAAAEAAAAFYVEQQHVIRAEGDASAMGEVTGRSGGIVMMGLTALARPGGQPLILYILREGMIDADIAALQRHGRTGSHVVVFGRRAHLDRLRREAIPFHAAINIRAADHDGLFNAADGRPVVATVPTANAAALWTWFSEFVAACTRLGAMPPLYKGYHTPGGKQRALRVTGERFHTDIDSIPIPAGESGLAYLHALRDAVNTLRDDERAAIEHVGSMAARRLAGDEQGSVYAFLHGHSILRHAPLVNDPGYFTQLNTDWTRMRDDIELGPGDMVLCIGYNQIFAGEDFHQWDRHAREAGAVPVWSIATFDHATVDAIHPRDILIRQPWDFGDAVVALPGYDIKMAPMSGVLAEAVYGMAVAAVHQRLHGDGNREPAALLQRTRLHEAVVKGDLEIVRLALAEDGSTDAPDYLGMTALHLAAQVADEPILDALLAAGADTAAADRFGRTPLHLAAAANRHPAARQLLLAGASALATDDAGETPLHRAARIGATEIARALLATVDASQAVTMREALHERTALHLAAQAGRPDMMQALVEAGATVDAADRWGMRPIHLAAMSGSVAAIDTLVAAGADPDARDGWGRSALHWAAQEHRLDALAALIARGVSPDARDRYGRTPLFDAAGVSANRQTLTLLLDAGADPRVSDTRGLRPTVGTWGWVGELLDLYASRRKVGR